MRNPEYFGDGVYAYFDGFGIELRANHHHQYPSDKVYIEPQALVAIREWFDKIKEETPK